MSKFGLYFSPITTPKRPLNPDKGGIITFHLYVVCRVSEFKEVNVNIRRRRVMKASPMNIFEEVGF